VTQTQHLLDLRLGGVKLVLIGDLRAEAR
jgi:hypothetical protein